MSVETVNVALGERSYDVRIGTGLIARAGVEITSLLARPRVAILTDEYVARAHLDALIDSLNGAAITHSSLTLPAGEATKSWRHLEQSVEWLLSERIERRDIVIALGGGVIGDLVGFAAAVTRRGIRFVQCPTSLLAQVVSLATKSEERPDGLDIAAPLALPWTARQVRVEPGRALFDFY